MVHNATAAVTVTGQEFFPICIPRDVVIHFPASGLSVSLKGPLDAFWGCQKMKNQTACQPPAPSRRPQTGLILILQKIAVTPRYPVCSMTIAI